MCWCEHIYEETTTKIKTKYKIQKKYIFFCSIVIKESILCNMMWKCYKVPAVHKYGINRKKRKIMFAS